MGDWAIEGFRELIGSIARITAPRTRRHYYTHHMYLAPELVAVAQGALAGLAHHGPEEGTVRQKALGEVDGLF